MATIVPDYSARAHYEPGRFTPVMIGESPRTRALLVFLEPGQFIPAHAPGVDVTFVVLEGTGTLIAGEDESRVGPGAVAFVPAGETRGLLAETRLVALHVVTPPPTEADHADVMAGLRRGTWR